MNQDQENDLNPYVAIALAMVVCGFALILFGVDWRAWGSCFVAAIVALIAWVRS